MAISASMVKTLREKTGVGMMDCKKALAECNGDEEKAIAYLREKGLAKAQKRAGRETTEGVIGSYIHNNGKLATLVSLQCETDFVAKNDKFQALAKDLAMQVAATNPLCVTPEDLDPEILEKEKQIYLNQAKEEGKPENIAAKIMEGRVKKFCQEVCLTEQAFIKDDSKKVGDLITDLVAVLGENIQIGGFHRMTLGE